MRTRQGSLLLAAVVLIGACGGGGDSIESPDPASDVTTTTTTTTPPARPATVELLTADLPRVEPETSVADVRRIAQSDFLFGLDLMLEVSGDENLVLSPFSIAIALSMLYAGASGNTAEQLADALHLDIPSATLHDVRNQLDQGLAEADSLAGDQIDKPLTISPANSLWVQTGFDPKEEFLRTLARHYSSEAAAVDFIGNPLGVRNAINDWVSTQTDERIDELLPEDFVTPRTRLVLVNAIYFSGAWEHPFGDDTFEAPFSLPDGSTAQAEFMSSPRTTFQWQDGPNYEAVKIPYVGDASMVIVIPRGPTPLALAGQLARGELALQGPSGGGWSSGEMIIQMPLFDFESQVQLREALEALGVEDAFIPGIADFSGIADEPLFVSGAVHQSSISVDQEGTEAAASTAIGMSIVSMPDFLVIDRPFLFWIEHEPTGEVLFLGQVTDPR